MVIENKYLRKAIEKTGYIVLVKRYIVGMPGSSLVYISPNASELGMNVEMLNKGLKLSEDYIYPSDCQNKIHHTSSSLRQPAPLTQTA